MNDNGQVNPPELPTKHASNEPPWRVTDEQARKAAVYMATRFTAKERQQYESEALAALEAQEHWRLRLIGRRRRSVLCYLFVETVEEFGDKEVFRAKAETYGFSIILLALVLGCLWDVLWFWWTHRDRE